MNPLFGYLLSNVSSGTANFLSYMMLVVVAIFLVTGPIITYFYYRQNKRMKAAAVEGSA
jgi:preprotein translocase subunit SecG